MCDGGADVSDRGGVLLLKLCRQPFTFEEASEQKWGEGKRRGRGKRGRGGEKQKEVLG